MPLIASFQGITIYMYTEVDTPHHLPHFHASYAEFVASFAVSPPVVLEGALPRRQTRFVLAWAELRQAELEENWRRVQNGEKPIRTAGLRSWNMSHKLYRVTNFQIVGDYLVRIHFDDGAQQVVNLEPVLYGEMWGPLRDLKLFNQVRIDAIAHTLTWPNGADFDPETLRHWDEYKDELAERAKSWERMPA